MPSRGDTQINNFVGGLVTEASPLTFPPNTSQDEINFKLKRDGTRERRLGLDFEDGYTLHSTGFTTEQFKRSRQRFFHWPTPSGSTKVDIGIFQIGGALYFADLFKEAPSSNLLNGGASVDSGLRGNVVLSFSIINNEVVITSSALPKPVVLSYNDSTDIVTATEKTVEIRDLYGVDDGLTDGERPATLTNNHKYNLRNQGWSADIVNTCATGEALECTQSVLSVYPSNSDTWSLGKIADVTDPNIDKYDPETLKRNSFDIGRAARGHYIIDLYDRGTSRGLVSSVPVSSVDRETGLISTSATYAGRIFYSGITSKVLGGDRFSPNLSGAVLFSQTVTNNDDIGKCYQQADPTSPTSNDIVDTDGGIIIVSGAVNIVKLLPIKSSLFVFAENGVWQIRGDEGGFRATSFQVNKISSIGVFSPESIVEANGSILFWAKQGIFALTPNQVDSTTFDATNLTLSTIQKGYDSLPNLVKQAAKGYYDVSNNTVRWLYQSDDPKVQGEPIDIQPTVPVFQLGAPATASAGLEPKVVRVNNTTALIIYANSLVRYVYYRVATINTTTLAITLGAETELVDGGSNGAIRGWALEKLSDDRVVAITCEASSATKARLITFSGSTPTVGSPTTINSVFGPVVTTSRVDTAPIDSTRIIVRARNLTNGVGSMQVVEVTGSTITFGTVVSTSSQNHRNPRVAMLSTGSGIYADQVQNGTTQLVSSFTVSGTAITLNTESVEPAAGDFPVGTTSIQSLNPDISALSATKAVVIGAGVITNGSVTSEDGILAYSLTINGSAVDISEAAFNITPTIPETTLYVSSLVNNGSLWITYAADPSTPNSLKLAKYVLGTYAEAFTVDLDTSTTLEAKPEMVLLGNNIAITAYRTITATDTIKAIGMRLA